MRSTPRLDSKISRIFRSSKTIKRLRHAGRWTLLFPSKVRVKLSGRAPPCQGGRREFEPRHPLQPALEAECRAKVARNTRGDRIPYYENNIALPVCARRMVSLPWCAYSSRE